MDWRRDWISSLYLSFQSGSVELQEEYLVYDFQVSAASNYSFIKNQYQTVFAYLQDLLSDLGSYLGLLLGW